MVYGFPWCKGLIIMNCGHEVETIFKFRASAPRMENHMDKTLEQDIDNMGFRTIMLVSKP